MHSVYIPQDNFSPGIIMAVAIMKIVAPGITIVFTQPGIVLTNTQWKLDIQDFDLKNGSFGFSPNLHCEVWDNLGEIAVRKIIESEDLVTQYGQLSDSELFLVKNDVSETYFDRYKDPTHMEETIECFRPIYGSKVYIGEALDEGIELAIKLIRLHTVNTYAELATNGALTR